MAFTENTSIQEIVILPLENNVQIKRRTVIEKDGEFVSSKDHYQLYASNNAEAIAILDAHNVKGIADASVALTAKTAAEAALAQALSDKDAAVAAATAPLQAEIARLTALVPAPVTATGIVTMRQARLALLQVGKYADVSTAIASMPEPQKTAATIEWEYASTVERSSTFVASMATALGLTEAEMDSLFVLAASL